MIDVQHIQMAKLLVYQLSNSLLARRAQATPVHLLTVHQQPDMAAKPGNTLQFLSVHRQNHLSRKSARHEIQVSTWDFLESMLAARTKRNLPSPGC